MARRRRARTRTRTRTITRYRTRVERAARRVGRGAGRGVSMLRRGKIKEVAAGVGGGFIGSLVANQVYGGRPNSDTVEGIVGLAASWGTGGIWGLAGYGILRLLTTGFSFGGRQISLRQLSNQGGAPALGVRVLR